METKFYIAKEADDILNPFLSNNFSTMIIRKESIIDGFYNLVKELPKKYYKKFQI
jgi:hypothetical protein